MLTLTPFGSESDLNWLLKWRGPRPTPHDVMVIGIDQSSAQHLGLSQKPRQWPRSLHARLIDKLVEEHARTIVFDIDFSEARDPLEDRLFSEAISRAGNVVLFEKLEKQWLLRGQSSTTRLQTERRLPFASGVERGAAGLGAFILPSAPARINRFWLFKNQSGIPTLPVVALHVYTLDLLERPLELFLPGIFGTVIYPEQITATEPCRRLNQFIQALREQTTRQPQLTQQQLAMLQQKYSAPGTRIADAITALIDLFDGDYWRYLDFYGPAHSIHTIPYYRALTEPLNAQGKAVFIGFSEQLPPPAQQDMFHTVFSRSDGVQLSGVEIAATAFANLLEGHRIGPLPPPWPALVIIVWGLVCGLLAIPRALSALALSIIGLMTTYLVSAGWLFNQYGVGLPLFVPLLLQAPMAALWALWSKTRRTRRVLGYLLPDAISDQLLDDPGSIETFQRQIDGVCLLTDITDFTPLAETLQPHELKVLVSNYYRTLFSIVEHYGGMITDAAGDSMLAIWEVDKPMRLTQACSAALAITAAIDAFNQGRPVQTRLTTRIGLHRGPVSLGHIGIPGRYQFRAVGNTINTAARIEGISKTLGVQILASQTLSDGLQGFCVRPLGQFRLLGKHQSLALCELRDTNELDMLRSALHEDFAAGLDFFRRGLWRQAQSHFEATIRHYGHDGPAAFYRDLCVLYEAQPPSPWDGIVTFTHK